jgi:hypothetical protein
MGMKDNGLPITHHVTTSYLFGRSTGVRTRGHALTSFVYKS